MRFKNHRNGRIYGLIQMLFWAFMIIWIIIVMPLNYYYSSPENTASESLQNIYDNPFFNWKVTSILILTFLVLLIGTILIWIGWYELHPIKVKISKDQRQREIDRYEAVKNFSKEKFLEELRKSVKRAKKH